MWPRSRQLLVSYPVSASAVQNIYQSAVVITVVVHVSWSWSCKNGLFTLPSVNAHYMGRETGLECLVYIKGQPAQASYQLIPALR